MIIQNPRFFEDLPGYTPHISRLLAMMHYVRETTLCAAEDLSVAQLDFLPHPAGNSIGMLLAHIAATEEGYYLGTVQNQRVDLKAPARVLGKAGRKSLRDQPLKHYLTELSRVREQTVQGFRDCDDAWLHTADMSRKTPMSNYFMWFHVFEDELNHRGQIRLIRRLLPAEL